MPVVYDHTDPRYIRHANNIWFRFNDKETHGTLHPSNWTTCHYEHIGGSAGVSTVVTIDHSEHLVDDNFISVVCEDVEAFVKHQAEELEYLSLTISDTDGDQKMLETNINRMCRCLENSLQSRTEKLKVKHLSLSVLGISQVVSAINLLDRDCLGIVTVHLPFDDQVFTAEDFIPLREGEKRQRFYLIIHLHKFSVEVLEEVRKLLAYASQFDFISIDYETIDEKCIELLAETKHSSYEKSVMFSIDHSDDPEEMARRNLSDNKCPINIFEIPSIMSSIASHIGCFEIQSLREVSGGIRRCVDYIKPETHILTYHIRIENYSMVIINENMSRGCISDYRGSVEQQAVRIVNDFYLYTRYQKGCMDELYIRTDEETWKLKKEDDSALWKFFKLLRKVLISRKSPLKVISLNLSTNWQCLVMDILPYLDAHCLESIIIQRIRGIDEECTIDLDEISKTEQWSKLKALQIKNLTVRMSIQEMNILNFERIDITLETMSQEDITYCRKASCFEYKLNIECRQ
ncbi:hypothetical protein CRE_10495 [Caenorhabditis remanei]|uniref:DUF38 domain-containing protein n=1 Tax=Caenorhabditis remanei TaxID=31234 RepID=E3N0W9_CAERE|nr:hypothetical protein CRE_10495 [Caenorhabditis remanei]